MIDLLTKKQKLLEQQLGYIQNQLEDIQKQIDAQPKIEPVFSGVSGIYAFYGEIDVNLTLWQKARARIIEKINIANNGDNGFKYGLDNFCFSVDARGVCWNRGTFNQVMEPMFYIRTQEAVQELLKDPQFCEDMRTYFKGWL